MPQVCSSSWANGWTVVLVPLAVAPLVMFTLGLEFRIKRVAQIAATSGLAAILETTTMFGLGYVAGYLLGFTTIESIFTGAIVAISSTTIIAKAFDDNGVRGELRQLVVAILIVEDLIAVLLMAILRLGDRRTTV